MTVPRTTDQRSNKQPNNGRPDKVRPHKRRGNGPTASKKLKFHSNTCNTPPEELSEFSKLDSSQPQQARRMEQRSKMILTGKNTAGYSEYISQVPKEKRRHRSMDTPMTPDHTLDIPNKRWVGQVRAWRRALHKYDPPDLFQSRTEVADTPEPSAEAMMTVQDQELADARTKGLLVDLSGNDHHDRPSPTSVAAMDQAQEPEMKEIDQWDVARGDGDFVCSDGDDSDDDLL